MSTARQKIDCVRRRRKQAMPQLFDGVRYYRGAPLGQQGVEP
jgi:hypothetical protein